MLLLTFSVWGLVTEKDLLSAKVFTPSGIILIVVGGLPSGIFRFQAVSLYPVEPILVAPHAGMEL